MRSSETPEFLRLFNGFLMPLQYREGYFIVSAPRRQKLNTCIDRSQPFTSKEKPRTTTFAQRWHATRLRSAAFTATPGPSAPPPPETMPRRRGRGALKTSPRPAVHRREPHAGNSRARGSRPPSHPILDAPRNRARRREHRRPRQCRGRAAGFN